MWDFGRPEPNVVDMLAGLLRTTALTVRIPTLPVWAAVVTAIVDSTADFTTANILPVIPNTATIVVVGEGRVAAM